MSTALQTLDEGLLGIVGVGRDLDISIGYDTVVHYAGTPLEDCNLPPAERVKLARAMIARWRNVILQAKLEARRGAAES